MAKYRIKKVYKYCSNDVSADEKISIQKKFLWWWKTVTIPIIMAIDGNDILEITVFGGAKLESKDGWFSEESMEIFFRVLTWSEYPNIGLAWWGNEIVFYDKKKYIMLQGFEDVKKYCKNG